MNRAMTVTEVSVMLLDEHDALSHAGPPVALRASGAGGVARVEPATTHDRPGLGSAQAGPAWRWAERTRAVTPAPSFAQPPRAAREAAVLSRPAGGAAPMPAGGAAAPGARTEVRIAPALLRAMETTATARGRQVSEVWAEAAREWLLRHAEDDDPQPPSPATAAPRSLASRSSRDRCWTAIDVLLGDLRAPRHAPLQPAAAESAA
jgi:hypothetical protein